MKESLVCCSIPRNLLLKQDYDKSIDKAEHTDNRISSDFYNAVSYTHLTLPTNSLV